MSVFVVISIAWFIGGFIVGSWLVWTQATAAMSRLADRKQREIQRLQDEVRVHRAGKRPPASERG